MSSGVSLSAVGFRTSVNGQGYESNEHRIQDEQLHLESSLRCAVDVSAWPQSGCYGHKTQPDLHSGLILKLILSPASS